MDLLRRAPLPQDLARPDRNPLCPGDKECTESLLLPVEPRLVVSALTRGWEVVLQLSEVLFPTWANGHLGSFGCRMVVDGSWPRQPDADEPQDRRSRALGSGGVSGSNR